MTRSAGRPASVALAVALALAFGQPAAARVAEAAGKANLEECPAPGARPASPGAAAPPAMRGLPPMRVVSGRPYSAVGRTSNVMHTADGNRIVRENVTRLARDASGRTRIELRIDSLGPLPLAEPTTLTIIDDPVAAKRYVLRDAERVAEVYELQPCEARVIRTAEQITQPGVLGPENGGGGVAPPDMPPPRGDAPRPPPGPAVRGEQRMPPPGRDGRGGIPMPPPPGNPRAMSGPAGGSGRPPPPPPQGGDPGADAAVLTLLPGRDIEGMAAWGVRRETTIPAGAIGNDAPLSTRIDQWFSPDLQLVIATEARDPFRGERSYRLEELRRGAPDAALFKVPDDYTLRSMRPGGPPPRLAPP